jgi:nucleoid DNA-binding protein
MAKKAAPTPSTPAPGRAKSATKAEIIGLLAEKTNLGKKEITGVLTALAELVSKELSKKGPGVFTIPGMIKLKVVRKPATKAKQGVNPFTKEPMTVKARPARNVVRAVPLKSLKELV